MSNLVSEDLFSIGNSEKCKWNKALNQLDFQNYRYRYFTLKNPPKKPRSSSFTVTHGKKENKNYEEVQEAIQELANLLVTQQESRLSQGLHQNAIDLLEGKIKTAKDLEIKLFSSLLHDSYNYSESQAAALYERMLGNTVPGEGIKTSSNYEAITPEQLNQMTTIEAWTRIANGGFNLLQNNVFEGLNLTEEQFSQAALSYICKSYDIYDELKSSRQQQIFSRHLAIEGTNYKITKEDSANINEGALRVFKESIIKWIDEGKFSKEIKDILSSSVYKVLSNWFEVRGTRIVNFKFRNTSEKPLASSVSETLRSNLQKALISIQNNPAFAGQNIPKNIELRNSSDKVFFYVDIPYNSSMTQLNGDSDFYIVMKNIFRNSRGSDFTKKKEFEQYLQEHPEAKRLLIKTFFEILGQGIESLRSKSIESLNLLSLGKFNIGTFIQAQKNEKLRNLSTRDFYTKALQICQSGKIVDYLFNSPVLIESAYESFRVANSNNFLSGLLGEISALFDLARMTKVGGKMTGSNVFSAITGYSSFGQSVHDLRRDYEFKDEKKKRKQLAMGVNVKRYAFSKNEVELYKGERGISVFKSVIRKYLGYEDTLIMRFMLENSGYFKDDVIERIGQRIAYKHLPEFYRVYDHEKASVKNLFFIINNVCYPSTYIYRCIIDKLEKEEGNEIMGKILEFQTHTMIPKKKSEYKDYGAAAQDYDDGQWRLQDKRYGSLDGSIAVNGLKINLVQLNLF